MRFVQKMAAGLGCAIGAVVVILIALAVLSFTPLQAPRPDILITVDSTAVDDIRFGLVVQDDSTPHFADHLLARVCVPVASDSAVIKIVAAYTSAHFPQPGSFLMFWAPAVGHEHLHITVGERGRIGFEPKACA